MIGFQGEKWTGTSRIMGKSMVSGWEFPLSQPIENVRMITFIWFNRDDLGIKLWDIKRYTLWSFVTELLNMAIEIVDLPIKHGDCFHSYVNVYQRVSWKKKGCWTWRKIKWMGLTDGWDCIPNIEYVENRMDGIIKHYHIL